MSVSKTSLRLLIVAVLVLVAYQVLWRGKGSPALTLPVATVERLAAYSQKAQCVGRVTSLGERYLTVQNGGRLEDLAVALGDRVEKDQILAVVDRTANSAGLKAALSGYRLAQKEHARIGSLSRSGSASREELDRALSGLEIKRAELEQAKQKVEDGIVRSPVAGKVSVLVFKAGDKVPDGSRIVAVDEATGVQVSCRMPSGVAAKLPEQTNAAWRPLDQGEAQPLSVATTVSLTNDVRGFVGLEREVRFAAAGGELAGAVGQRVQIEVDLPALAEAARIPSAAVVSKSDGDFIFVKSPQGEYQQIRVNVLQRDMNQAVVMGIPAEGDVLVVNTEISKVEAMLLKKGAGKKGG